jgi:hypothetical protein
VAKAKIISTLTYMDALKEKRYKTSYLWNKMGFVLTEVIDSTRLE